MLIAGEGEGEGEGREGENGGKGKRRRKVSARLNEVGTFIDQRSDGEREREKENKHGL